MKIVYVTSSFPHGPGEAFLIPEITELIRQGHEVSIVPLYPRGSVLHKDALPLLGETKSKPLLSLEVLFAALGTLFRHPALLFRLLRLIGHGRPKILFKNLTVLPKALWLAQFASVWGAQHIHAHWATTTSTAALVAAEVAELPWSFTAHRWDIVENNLLQQKLAKASFARFISRSGLSMAREITPLPGDKCFVLHMGVALPAFNYETPCLHPSPGAPAGPPSYPDGHSETSSPILFCPANLIPVKGHRYLLLAMAILKSRQIDANLWLAGQGELRSELQHFTEKLNLADRVCFLGEIPHERLLQLYADRTVAVVVLPSVDLGHGLHEGIPVSLMEAMSFAIPTVSTRTGGIPELLGNDAGLVVPAQNPQALADALEKLLFDAKLRSEVGAKGYQRISNQFSAAKTAAGLTAIFERRNQNHNSQRQALLLSTF